MWRVSARAAAAMRSTFFRTEKIFLDRRQHRLEICKKMALSIGVAAGKRKASKKFLGDFTALIPWASPSGPKK